MRLITGTHPGPTFFCSPPLRQGCPAAGCLLLQQLSGLDACGQLGGSPSDLCCMLRGAVLADDAASLEYFAEELEGMGMWLNTDEVRALCALRVLHVLCALCTSAVAVQAPAAQACLADSPQPGASAACPGPLRSTAALAPFTAALLQDLLTATLRPPAG